MFTGMTYEIFLSRNLEMLMLADQEEAGSWVPEDWANQSQRGPQSVQ